MLIVEVWYTRRAQKLRKLAQFQEIRPEGKRSWNAKNGAEDVNLDVFEGVRDFLDRSRAVLIIDFDSVCCVRQHHGLRAIALQKAQTTPLERSRCNRVVIVCAQVVFGICSGEKVI